MNFQTLAAEYLLDMGYRLTKFQTVDAETLTKGDYYVAIGPNWIQVRKYDDNFNIVDRISFTAQKEMAETDIIYLFHAMGVVTLKEFVEKGKSLEPIKITAL